MPEKMHISYPPLRLSRNVSWQVPFLVPLNRLNSSFFRHFFNDLNISASFLCRPKPVTLSAIDVQARRQFQFGFVSIKFVFAVTMKLQEACADWLLEEAA